MYVCMHVFVCVLGACSQRSAPSPPFSFAERLLQCAAEWQNQYTFCFPAIPHIHVFAAMKCCTIESEEVRRSRRLPYTRCH